MLTYVVVGAVVVLALAGVLLVRWRRSVAQQSTGGSFSAAEFSTLIDNLSWYRHSAGEPPSGRHAARPEDG